LEKIARSCIEQKENVDSTFWGFGEKKSVKSEAQDCLDQILKLAYPHISRARKFNDIKKPLKMSDDGKFKFCLLPDLLPMGHEDKTQLIVGVQTDEEGEKSLAKIGVWRTEKFVWYEHQDTVFYKSIISESEPVDMEDASGPVHLGPITLSASGEAEETKSAFLLDYILFWEEHNDRPVYSNNEIVELHRKYIFSTEDGCWAVSRNIGDDEPDMKSTSPAPCPTFCQHWEYRHDGEYHPGDIMLTVPKKGKPGEEDENAVIEDENQD